MLNKMGVVALILLCCISFASAAVNEKKSDVDIIGQFGEYTITPAKDLGGGIAIRYVYDTIIQGETNCHTKTVDTDITVLNVYLNWSDWGERATGPNPCG